MSDLPKGWAKATVDDTGDYINGMAFKPTDWEVQGRPIIRIQNLTNPEKVPNRTTREVEPRHLVECGDILVSWSATLDAFIWDREQSVLNQHIFKVVPNERVVGSRFLFHGLRTVIREIVAGEHLHGSTMKHINRGPFLAHPFPLPPLREQQRIVAKIDSLTGKSRRARDRLDHIPRLVEKYKQAILAAAFDGRLTRLKPDQLTFVELGTLLQSGPQNGLYLPKDRYGSGAPILRIQNYGLNSVDPINTWSRVDVQKSIADKYALACDDLVINRVNSPSHLGKSMVVSTDMEGALFESNMMRLRLRPGIDPRFVQLYLSSSNGRSVLTKGAKWAVNQASINQGDVTGTLVPTPDHHAQMEIVQRIDLAFNWIDRLAADASNARKLMDHLDQSVLAKAFKGELVPQDPADEPASALLDRIRAERAAVPKTKRGRKKAA